MDESHKQTHPTFYVIPRNRTQSIEMTGSVLSSSHGQVFAGARKMARIGADKSATTVIYRSPTVSLTYTYYKTSTVHPWFKLQQGGDSLPDHPLCDKMTVVASRCFVGESTWISSRLGINQ